MSPTPPPQSKHSETANHHIAAGFSLLVAAGLWSTAPAIIHLTARDTNPFLFNALIQFTTIVFLSVILVITRHRWNHAFDLDRISTHQANYRGVLDMRLFCCYMGSIGRGQDRVVVLRESKLGSPFSLLRTPIVWLALSGLELGLLTWSTRYIETAVASTVYELWPAFLVFMLIRHDRTHSLFLNQSTDKKGRKKLGHWEQKILALIAGVGLVFMLQSQAEPSSSLAEIVSLNGILGLLLAIFAGAGTALNIVSSLAFGRTAFYGYFDGLSRPQSANGDSRLSAEERGQHGRRLLMWFTLLGFLVGRFFTVSLSLLLGLTASNAYGGIAGSALVGAITLGIVGTGTIVLIRVGNTLSARPEVNTISYITPLLALTWLLFLGVSLPRFDLFIVGAALILAINVLLQLKPDAERDLSKFGRAQTPGTRLGFTTFILSIWVFGAVVYLRDEIMPASWLSWELDDYWGLIGLSATVFALILGFRIARLSTRITKEDELMLGLFRDCEHLERQGVLNQSIVGKLERLDTALPSELLPAYNDARSEIKAARKRQGNAESHSLDVARQLMAVEKELDVLAHSKQQGRDIVELFSLVAFAVVTVGLGLLSRPISLMLGSWTGFLSEVFALLFASTVAFLCVNLFDIRRDRETPLLVVPDDATDDHVVFFRYKGDLKWQRAIAMLISVAMASAFIALFYDKWF